MIKDILVIEDDRFIGEMYVRALKSSGFSVDWVVDGNDGLVMARNKAYDLILLDIMLPEKRGNVIVEELNSEASVSKDAKIIFMTNFHHTPQEKEEFAKISDYYFVKSEIVPRKLVSIIRKM